MTISKTPYSSFEVEKGRFVFIYNIYPDNMVEIIYHNKKTHYKKIFHIYFEDKLDLKTIEKAIKLADQLYDVVDVSVSKPNIPVYALIYVLNETIPGFSYKCKIKKELCPIKVFRYEGGRELRINPNSIMEQMYRVFKKYRDKLKL